MKQAEAGSPVLFRRRQGATLIFFLVGFAMFVMSSVLTTMKFNVIGLITLIFLLACLVLFSSLTVEATKDAVRLYFGPGIIRRTFTMSDIRRATIVRNSWAQGFGIRRLSRGWMYNVSGLDAVELEMADGTVHRIGTDRPKRLLAAIKEAQDTA